MLRLLLLLLFACSACTAVYAQQCNVDSLRDISINTLPKGYSFVKNFRVQRPGNGRVALIEYSNIFTKGNTYCIVIRSADGKANGIVLRLYDAMRNEIATNLSVKDNSTNEFEDRVIFNCHATGMYYLKFSFKDSKKGCASTTVAVKVN